MGELNSFRLKKLYIKKIKIGYLKMENEIN